GGKLRSAVQGPARPQLTPPLSACASTSSHASRSGRTKLSRKALAIQTTRCRAVASGFRAQATSLLARAGQTREDAASRFGIAANTGTGCRQPYAMRGEL